LHSAFEALQRQPRCEQLPDGLVLEVRELLRTAETIAVQDLEATRAQIDRGANGEQARRAYRSTAGGTA